MDKNILFMYKRILKLSIEVQNNYFYDLEIIENIIDESKGEALLATRTLVMRELHTLEENIKHAKEILESNRCEIEDCICSEYDNCDGTHCIYDLNDGDTTTSKVRKDVIKSLKERDSNE